MVDYAIRKPTQADIDYLTENLRAIDRREISAVSGRNARSALISGWKTSDYCRVGLADDLPICIYGVRQPGFASQRGIVWMLATDDLPRHAMKFGRACSVEVSKMLEGNMIIENQCHAENKTTIRWLKWMGFKMDEAKPFGRKGELFHHFWMEAV